MRLFLFLLLGCSVSDPSLLDPLRDDGTVDLGPDEDTGPDEDMPIDIRVGSNTCGDAATFVIGQRELGLRIDTTTATNNTMVPCASSLGNERFYALDVVAGEVWHFHLSVAPESEAKNPVLYLLAADCDDRACIQNSDACVGTGDEHFAFVAPSTGRWYVGVDSADEGGGVFIMDAYRPTCGDGEKTHGETCDSDSPDACGGAGCFECRCRVTPTSPGEKFPNDNLYEANEIDTMGADAITITGGLGGAGSCEASSYPDVYTLTIDDDEDLRIRLNDFSGTPCSGPDAVPVELTLLSRTGNRVLPASTDANGCSQIDAPDLGGARYYVEVRDARPVDRSALAYQLDLTISP